MPFKFTYYKQIKDSYCIAYFGHNAEYLIQLKLLRPYLNKQFEGLRIYLACQNNLLPILKNEVDVISKENLFKRKRAFGNVEELTVKLRDTHPIETYLEQIGLKCPIISNESEIRTKKCVIASKRHLPVGEVPDKYIQIIVHSMQAKGYEIRHNIHIDELDSAGWVIGVENEITFEAAARGIKTTLIPTGAGTELFKQMFPAAEIFNISKLK